MVIAVIGGDARMFTVANRLCLAGHAVKTACLPESESFCRRVMQTENIGECLSGADAVVLPFPAFKNGALNAPLVSGFFPQEEILKAAEGKLLLGGMLPFKDADHIDYGDDEKLLTGNAMLTAEGALALIINNTPKAVGASVFVVAGYGRIAKSLAPMLKALGGRVIIAARSSKARGDAIANGFESAGFDETEAPFSQADALINTVPARTFNAGMLGFLKHDALYLELASPPYGAEKQDVLNAGARYILAPGIPGRIAPQTAGELIYSSIKNILRERGK